MTESEKYRRRHEAEMHLEFACSMYFEQAKAGRILIHEHPATAGSWKQKCVREVLRRTGACIVEANMCAFGMTTTAGGVTGLAYKPTWFMTKSPEIAAQLNRQCTNKSDGYEKHEHVQLE